MLEKPGHRASIVARLPRLRTIGCAVIGLAGPDRAAIGRVARYGDLGADVAVALLHETTSALLDLLEVRAAGVAIHVYGLAALAAEQLIDRHTGAFTENVPQRHVYAADGVAEHRAVPPIRRYE